MSQSLAELLAAGEIEQFNAQRGERSRPDLFAAELAGKVLTGADLSSANLEKADLTEADFTEVNLMRALVAGADGTGAKFVDALGLRARFKGAWMDKCDLSGSDFSESDFADSVLEGSRAVGTRFHRARLRGCDARGAQWPECDLSEAKLHQANFSGADLHGADLTEASGAESDWSEAKLDGIVGVGVKLPGAKLAGASLAAARIPGANLAGADLTGANLMAADLSRANLTGADLTGANLTGAVLADACLDDAVLDGVTFDDTDMSGLDPATLGLDAETIEKLSSYGVAFNPDAPLFVAQPAVARSGDAVAMVWENPDGDEQTSLRFAIVSGTDVTSGIVPVPGDMALDYQVVAAGDAFRVVVTRSRPDGPAVVNLPLSTSGELSGGSTAPLGYDPGVRPVLRSIDGVLHMWGLARRGPTLVVHRDGDEGLVPVRSERVATAQGFLRGQSGVLACKGGVVMPTSHLGAGKPRRTPEGFGGRWALAMESDDDLVTVWVVKAVGDSPGGLRMATLPRRGDPRVEVLSLVSGVVAVGGTPLDEGARVFWAEGGADGLSPTTVYRADLPSGGPQKLPVDLEDVVEVHASDDVLVLVRGDGSAWVGTHDGTELGRVGS